MTTIEKIKAEILDYFLWDGQSVDNLPLYVRRVLNIIDKYAEQEPCDDVVSRQAIMKLKRHNLVEGQFVSLYDIERLPSVTQKPNYCASCKHNTNNEICLECEYDGITRGMTRYESVTQKPSECDDAISRQAVLDGIEEIKQSPWATDKRGNGFEYLITEALDVVADLCVKQEPSVRPQEQTGHWIEKDGFDGDVYYDCSECGESWTTIEGTPWQNGMNYCPNCGCRMVEPQESEDKGSRWTNT